jgi:hypothetical protein
MYVGSTAFFGFINYLVCPIALLLGHRPTRTAVVVRDGKFIVESDAAVPIEVTHLGCGSACALPSDRGFKCLSKNASTAARIMSVLNSGLPCPAPAIL